MSVDSNGGTPSQSTPPPQATPAPRPPAGPPHGYGSPSYPGQPGSLPPPLQPNSLNPNGAGAPAAMPASIPSQAGGPEPMSAIPFATGPSRYPTAEPEPAPIPTPGLISSTQLPSVRIGLWGASRAGKSTYLAALPIAGMQTRDPNGRWIVGGVGANAVEYLVNGVDLLAKQRLFPPATQVEESLTWVFQGPPPPERRFLRWQPGGAGGVQFALQLQDAPGEFMRTGRLSQEVVDQFATSQGLVYLFDPVGDAEERLQSFDFFYAMLQEVYARVRQAGRLYRNRLPHHVAVLVTKFDAPEIFDPAVHAGWVNQEPGGSRLPVVLPKHGPAFFDWVCRGYRGGTATMIADALQAFFHTDRVRYYATSAIGFRLNRDLIFDYNDYRNTEMFNGKPRIRTMPRPINVLEPLIELERRISAKKK